MSEISKKIEEELQNNEGFLIMAVGDSITWGMNHCTREETFCAVLARLLAERFNDAAVLRYDGKMTAGAEPLDGYEGPVEVSYGSKGKITVVRSGVGGDTVRRALNRSDDYTGSFLTGEMPNLFLLMFGINDALRGDPSKYVLPEKYYDDLKELYCLLRKTNPSAEIVFMTPTYNDGGASDESCLEPYCEMMKKLANETDRLLIDTHKLWMEHLVVGSKNYGQGEWLSDTEGDSCHFSPVGSKATGEFIFSELFE